MAGCHDMKEGEIYVRGDCGLELQVIKECQDIEKTAEECSCHTDNGSCLISCCGMELKKKWHRLIRIGVWIKIPIPINIKNKIIPVEIIKKLGQFTFQIKVFQRFQTFKFHQAVQFSQ